MSRPLPMTDRPPLLTTALAAWLDRYGTAQGRKEVVFVLQGYLEAWTVQPPKESPAAIGRQLGMAVSALAAGEQLAQGVQETITCRAGCAHCCKQAVAVTPVEAEALVDYVFLGEHNSCRVYDVRPLACRKYFSVGEPELCNIEKYPGGPFPQWISVNAEILTSAAYTQWGKGYLPPMVLAALARRKA